jgi:hypothetical protein
LLFPFVQPMVAWNPAVMFVGFPVASSPIRICRRPETDPIEQLLGSHFGPLGPLANIVDDFIALLMGNPAAF